jgi:hypothetical protein
MREAVIASQPTDAGAVGAAMIGPIPDGKPVWYQKHMTHHMVDGFGRDWICGVVNAFLIRAPEPTLASYRQKRGDFTLEEIGLPAQVDLFERAADRLGHAPPVIDSADVLGDPRGTLSALCAACGIGFSDAMLSWTPGPRASDGVWAKVWYDSVERSNGFAPPRAEATIGDLPDALRPLAAAARPLYERLAAHRLRG